MNDDTYLYKYAISDLHKNYCHVSEQGYPNSIVVGTTQDPITGALTYGGQKRVQGWHPFKFSLVIPGNEVKQCDTMNGNCFLLPRSVANLVCEIDPAFTHYLGDFDYGLRAKKKNCFIWVIPVVVGVCAFNPLQTQTNSPRVRHSVDFVLAGLKHPKGLIFNGVNVYPPEEWKLFARRHGGFFWWIFWLLPYRRILCNCNFFQFSRPILRKNN